MLDCSLILLKLYPGVCRKMCTLETPMSTTFIKLFLKQTRIDSRRQIIGNSRASFNHEFKLLDILVVINEYLFLWKNTLAYLGLSISSNSCLIIGETSYNFLMWYSNSMVVYALAQLGKESSIGHDLWFFSRFLYKWNVHKPCSTEWNTKLSSLAILL